MAHESKSIPNLIQGVSQQAPQQRRDSQCEAQFDCLNSPKDGCLSRNGFDYLFRLPGANLSEAFFYEFFRGSSEHYLMFAKTDTLKVLNLGSGTVWTASLTTDQRTYINSAGPNFKDNFVAQTVEDTTFLTSKGTVPAMLTATSPTRPKEALVFFKAGGYAMKFSISLTHGGNNYTWRYRTPDNSTAANANFIATGQIAATFYRAMTGTAAPAASTFGTGASEPGDTNPTLIEQPSGTPTLASLGFNIEINGNLLRIWRTDGEDFGIDTADGYGDTYLLAFKDSVRAFTDLPRGGFEGMTFAVRGRSDDPNASNFFVEFVQKTASQGYWQERVKPGIQYEINRKTMPHILRNTGLNTFTFSDTPWSTRIAGSGERGSAENPGFIGRTIQDAFWHKGRLAFMTEATIDWSKARNPYTHFPDTVQTVLADAPIGITVAAEDRTALLRKALLVDGGLSVWAQEVQFRVHSGAETFRQDTVEADPTTNYEFAEKANFGKSGQSVFFVTEPDEWASLRSVVFQNGRVVGDVDVTDHVPEYIPAGVRVVATSDTGKTIVLFSQATPNRLYVYNHLTAGQEIVQSAWNTWHLPEGTILWTSIYRMNLFVAMDRGGDLVILRCPLRPSAVDPGGEYRTRLDLRLSETQVTLSYNASLDRSTITLPLPLIGDEVNRVIVALRSNGVGPTKPYRRGRIFKLVSASGTSVVVEGDLRDYEFYVGLRISSIREESEFHIRGEQGAAPVDDLTIREFKVLHSRTGYYRIEVDIGGGRTTETPLKTVVIGVAGSGVGYPPPLVSGDLSASVDQKNTETRIRLVNDSILPSRWQSAEYRYEAVMRARPSARK